MIGPLALIGGDEFTAGCSFDAGLLEESGGSEVLVLPTASAYEQPSRIVDRARTHFSALGATVETVPLFRRRDAMSPELADIVGASTFIYLTGGSPMHLRSVVFDSPVWDAVLDAWMRGAVLAASGESASALGAHMVDPRGGAFTLGLGLFDHFTVIPRASEWSEEKWHRTIRLASASVAIVGIDAATALISGADGWKAEGHGSVTVQSHGHRVGLNDLAALGGLRPR